MNGMHDSWQVNSVNIQSKFHPKLTTEQVVTAGTGSVCKVVHILSPRYSYGHLIPYYDLSLSANAECNTRHRITSKIYQ